jgi:hypothetical protein
VERPGVRVEIDGCIVGGLRIAESASVSIADSIVDATSVTSVALAAPDGQAAGGMLQVVDSTIIGKVRTAFLEYASNTIFLARSATGDGWPQAIRSERRQAGCVRFSFLDLASAVPRRFHCQPDLEVEERIAAREQDGVVLTDAQRAQVRADVVARLVPRFTSLRYGDPGFGQLHVLCPGQIRLGADDEAEMGAFHGLYAPQREANVRVRLDEYLRVGMEGGVLYAT